MATATISATAMRDLDKLVSVSKWSTQKEGDEKERQRIDNYRICEVYFSQQGSSSRK
jgi:hypothetical protein